MNFKRITSILLVLVMLAFSLASCSLEQITADIKNIFGNDDDTNVEQPEKSWEELYDIITLSEALDICGEPGNPTTEKYYIKGKIISVDDISKGTMIIKDETGEIYVDGVYSEDGSLEYTDIENKPHVDDEVLLYCRLQNREGTKTARNARLIDFKKAEYPELDIKDAREVEVGTKVKVTGVVARFTYAFGLVPSGFYLVDGTDSIYVYGKDIAAEVSVGNKITLLASKTYWILEDEKNSADKFGYKGCCQLENATLLENDGSKNDVDLSWCEEKTVKDIMELPVTENITTTVFKTTALIKKVEGTGFLNYYIDDLDGKTGSYVYTQCSGSDFAWLDEFDGKICTVYLSVINAKSSSTGCLYRFLPIKVVDEGFEFDLNKVPEHVVEYYGVDQFLNEYTGDPNLELITEVSSDLLGFNDATLSYTSNNNDVVYFTEEDGKTVLHCSNEGTATVTVTANYGSSSHSVTIDITVKKPAEVPSISVGDAINTAVGQTVTVKGIVGPSLVNQVGFYLIDETGVIAVKVNDASVFDGLEIGQQVIIQGLRDKYNSNESSNAHGVTCITSATVVSNYFGSNEYSTATFITGKTLADIAALNINEDHSTEVYVIKATIVWNETAFYTNVKLQDGDSTLNLYCSGAGQYSFLKEFAGQEVTIEIAPCNWNGKNYWAGCILSVITEDGKIYNELNFTNN